MHHVDAGPALAPQVRGPARQVERGTNNFPVSRRIQGHELPRHSDDFDVDRLDEIERRQTGAAREDDQLILPGIEVAQGQRVAAVLGRRVAERGGDVGS